MKFDRWNIWRGRSRAYDRFKEHHTEINNIYWALAPAAGCVKYMSRNSGDEKSTAKIFHASGQNSRRISPNIAGWSKDFEEFENWVRLSMLSSALSYLEVYLSTIITTALRSDPLLRYKQPRAVDGVLWLKRDVKDDISQYVTPCIKGAWSQRLAGYRNLFVTTPPTLDALQGNLERMRNLRNGVAHSFGRSLNYFEDATVQPGVSERLSEDRLLQYLADIEQAALAVDSQVASDHLGEFELIWQYHRWKGLDRKDKEPKYSEWVGFSRNIKRVYGQGPGRAFCRHLISYYDNLN
jgi:hypothetical protein